MAVTKPELMPVPFANAGLKNTIPVTPPGGSAINQASYDAGFPPTTMTPIVSGGKPPRGRDMNGILYDVTSHLTYLNAGGQYWFDADFASKIGGYPLGAVLQSNDGKSSYVSIVDNNTTDFNSDPSSIGTSWLPWAGEGASSGSGILFGGTAGGTSEIITAAFEGLTELTDGLLVSFRATAANTSTNPSFNASSLGALTIVKGADLPLAAGDISGEGYLAILQYSATWNKWVLQNPAKGIDVSTGVPVGTVVMFTAAEPPAGYLKCDGSAVGRTTYPELYAAIGTTYGAGDGSTTFNLPDLIGRFAEGSATPGTVKEAGLPNITGSSGAPYYTALSISDFGAFYAEGDYSVPISNNGSTQLSNVRFDASRSNSIYGKSDTVQPPALTLLPCIKAFDASVNPGLIDITELANDVAGKADISLSNLSATGKSVVASLAMPSSRYIDLTFGASGTTYTAPADGWVFLWRICSGQGGIAGLYGRVVSIFSGDANEEFCIYIPVAKGEVFNIYYAELKTGQSTDYFRFFYANGSQS
nr:MAG TPA: tail fiber protein [Caudoviricetes sp.]